jgi:hypothetical protein
MAVVHSGDVGIYYPNHHLDTIAGGGLKAAIDVIRNSNKQEGISFHNTFISLGSNKVIPIRITTEDFQNFIAEVQLNLMTDEFGISSSTSEDQIITRWRIQVDEDRISVRSSYSPHVSETSLHMFSEGGRNPVHFWIGNTQTTGSIELK